MKSKVIKNMERMDKVACKRKKDLKKAPTLAEIKFRKLLNHYKIQHSFQRILYTPDRYYILDFVCRLKPRVIIEIDGSVHDNRYLQDRDREIRVLNTRTYRKYKFLRISNEQVFNGEAESILRSTFPRRARDVDRLSQPTVATIQSQDRGTPSFMEFFNKFT